MRAPNHNSLLGRRCGFTMIELTVAATLLGTVFVVTLPLLKHVRTSRDTAQQQFIAQQEAANIMEQLAIKASSDLTNESLTVSPEAAAHLPDADVTITRQSTDDRLQQVTVALSWTNPSGEQPTPVTLTAWFHAVEEVP